MSRETNLQKTQELYAAFGRGDIATILAAMDPAMVWVNPGPSELARYFGTHTGPQTIAQNVFAFLGETFEIHAFEPHTFIADGDYVVALVRMDSTVRTTSPLQITSVGESPAISAGSTRLISRITFGCSRSSA